MAKPASFAELVNEATELASQVAMLEEEVMDSFERTGRIITAYNKRERRANIAASFGPLHRRRPTPHQPTHARTHKHQPPTRQ